LLPKPGSPFLYLSAAIVAAACLLSGCNSPGRDVATPIAATSANAGTSAPVVASNAGLQPSDHEPFDSQRAMAILKKQCDFGVRPLGTEAHEKTKDYLIAQMKLYANETKLQQFTYRSMPVTNIVGVFYPAGSDKPSEHPILLLTHWDTRPVADGPFSTQSNVKFRYGPTGWNPTSPILGANDAASGVAVLLELARMFKQKPPPVGVIMLLDDGEDYGDFTAYNNRGEGVELGARHFAKTYRTEKSFGQPVYGILLDMVGAKNAFFVPEALSVSRAPDVNRRVFRIGQALGYGDIFRTDGSQSVGDDHVSINEAGIPTIDLIHPLPFSEFAVDGYRFWHTLEDTPDKCSPTTLKAVGDTLAETIYREEASK
jgi:glutaminyl-peptide cyclotransferase